MTTTVQQIFDAALDRNTFNDTDLVNYPRAIAWLDRLVKRIYGQAARPSESAQQEQDNYFTARTTVTMGGAFTVLPAAVRTAVWLPPRFFTAAGKRVKLVNQLELADSTAELPPAIIWEGRQISITGRAGDVAAGDVLTILYTPLPGTLADVAHFIGAATPTDSATTIWPDQPGNEALISELARYLALKDGAADPQEVQKLEDERTAELDDLMLFLRGRP